jgi:hypothetical protein
MMQQTRKLILSVVSIVGLGVLLLISSHGAAQDKEEKPKRETFQAQAMGQSSQAGQNFNVTVNIAQYSTPEERQNLVEAFEKAGSKGLFNALEKMPAKGRIAVTGTLGYDISFVREIPTAEGRKIRILTNRPIRFGEAWVGGRTMDYNLSYLELELVADKGKSTGVLLPACQFKIDKKTNEVVVENYRNPWKLTNILNRTED